MERHTCLIWYILHYMITYIHWYLSTFEIHSHDLSFHTYTFKLHSYVFKRFMVKPHISNIRWHTSIYEWHTDDIRVHTSDIRTTYEYIRVTYRWYTTTYEWHTDDIRVYTTDIRIAYECIYINMSAKNDMQMAYEWYINRIKDLELLNCSFQNGKNIDLGGSKWFFSTTSIPTLFIRIFLSSTTGFESMNNLKRTRIISCSHVQRLLRGG